MNQKKNAVVVIFLLVGVSLLFSNLSRQETAKELFEKAVYLEETKGDLEKAIAAYDQEKKGTIFSILEKTLISQRCHRIKPEKFVFFPKYFMVKSINSKAVE